MATKEFDSSLGDNQKFVNGNFVSNQNAQYSNLNLNANHKCSSFNPIQSKNELINSKSTKNYDGLNNNEGENGFSRKNNSWNKTGKSFHSNDLKIYDSKEGAGNYIGYQKRWKNESLSKDNKSTLSLHISAYENSVEVENEQNDAENCSKPKSCKSNKSLECLKGFFSGLTLKNVFEVPRQQDETKSEPEIMQMKASQRLLNPNTTNVNVGEIYSGTKSSMDPLIPVICELRSVLTTVQMKNAIDLPQIVVVGSQSDGKSSVIEGLVGRDFLPRGIGTVTRRPLLIQLINTTMDDPQRQNMNGFLNGDWATFEHLKDKRFVDFEEVRKEIERETNNATGNSKGISIVPINLKIYSANVVDLTLIDLPGLIKLSAEGQPPDLKVVIRQMVIQYISNPNSLILAVTPANADFQASEALDIAREVDPNGDRTLAVLTKLDLMDKGTDAMDVLTGKVFPVKLGIIGVVGRSQEDIDNKKKVGECLEAELVFLQKKYSKVASKNGIQYLAKTLNKLLLNNIRKILPGVRHQIATTKAQYEAKLKCLGEPIADNQKSQELLQIIHNFVSTLIYTIDGNSEVVETSEEVGGALLARIFYGEFADQMKKIDSLNGLTDKEIRVAQENVQSTTPAIYPNQKVFEALVKKQILLLSPPSLNCLNSAHIALQNIVARCGTKMQENGNRFPLLFERIAEEINGFLEKRIPEAKDRIEELLARNREHINTKHPDFDKVVKELFSDKPSEKSFADAVSAQKKSSNHDVSSADKQNSNQENQVNVEEKKVLEDTKKLIKGYFETVLKIVQDQVPKIIMYQLVRYLKQFLETTLVMNLQKIQETKEKDLLCEDKDTAKIREETSKMLDALTEADNALNRIHGMHIQ